VIQRLVPVGVGEGLAAEAITGTTGKDAKGGNRNIRELMRAALIPQRYENPATGDIVTMVDETAGERLDEYERAMAGRQQITWSKGRWSLRAAAGLDEEQQTEEEIVAEELQGEDVAILPRQSCDAEGSPQRRPLRPVPGRQARASATAPPSRPTPPPSDPGPAPAPADPSTRAAVMAEVRQTLARRPRARAT
jgi:hypothetical protein